MGRLTDTEKGGYRELRTAWLRPLRGVGGGGRKYI
jgi:hypothetical protein